MKTLFAAATVLLIQGTPTNAARLRSARQQFPQLPKAAPKVATTNHLLKALKKAKLTKRVDQKVGVSVGGKPATSSFNPQVDDPEWPGAYPSGAFGSSEELVINLREDDYPGEIYMHTRVVFSLVPSTDTSTTRSFQPGATKIGVSTQPKAEDAAPSTTRKLVSIPIESDFFDATETLYQIEFTDISGDGICCAFGKGWITVTNRAKEVLWSAVGDYSYVASVYLWKDATGNYKVVGATDSIKPGGEGEVTVPDPYDPPTYAPTYEPQRETTQSPQASYCSLCPYGSIGDEAKLFLLGEEMITCADMVDVYQFGLDSTECQEFEDGGITDYYRALCECPGYKPSCALCDGNQVASPDLLLPSDDAEAPELTCLDFEIYFMTQSASECTEWDSDLLETFETFCGCL